MDRDLCLVCAWRQECKKRFRPGGNLNCQDYTKDLAIKQEEASEPKAEEKIEAPKGLWNI